jgi:hypothetical protein
MHRTRGIARSGPILLAFVTLKSSLASKALPRLDVGNLHLRYAESTVSATFTTAKATEMSAFSKDIEKFNGIYKLPVSVKPTLDVGVPVAERLRAFKNILNEEIDEIDEIITAIEGRAPSLEVLTMLADLLGDIQVYCASEMAKFGLPLDDVLAIIMRSNFSKLGADGKPIYDERGKVQKGPNYWKPEPKIKELLSGLDGVAV